jgi:hypothetical protein
MATFSTFARQWPSAALCTLLLCLAVTGANPAFAVIRGCQDLQCDRPPDPPFTGVEPRPGLATRYQSLRSEATFRPDFKQGSALAQQATQTRASTQAKGSLPGQSLYGELAGNWDVVTGYVTFPYLFEGSTPDQLLLRGLPTEPFGGDLYQVQGWQRSAYWINTGDGIPRLLSSELIIPGYVPEPDHPFTDAGDLNYAQLVLYREQGRDYSAYLAGGAFAVLLFVADPDNGDVIDAVVDLYDADGNYEKTEYLYAGDSIMPLLISYRLSEPDVLYYAEYTDYIPLTQDVSINLANHVPGVDFIDPFLNAIGFDADRPLELLLEGFRDLGNGETQWAYSEIYPLGYNWPEARDRLFAGDFEALVGRPDGNPPGSIVRPRP